MPKVIGKIGLLRAAEVLGASLRLGLTAFGGPIAHLGHFERVFVRERRWLTGEQFGGLVALCHLLPGPTSSQVGFLIGWQRGGVPGAIAAWVGFTLPSALAMYACAVLVARIQGPVGLSAMQGFKLLAVAVVAQAVIVMAKRSCTALTGLSLAVAAAGVALAIGGTVFAITRASSTAGAEASASAASDVVPVAQPPSAAPAAVPSPSVEPGVAPPEPAPGTDAKRPATTKAPATKTADAGTVKEPAPAPAPEPAPAPKPAGKKPGYNPEAP